MDNRLNKSVKRPALISDEHRKKIVIAALQLGENFLSNLQTSAVGFDFFESSSDEDDELAGEISCSNHFTAISRKEAPEEQPPGTLLNLYTEEEIEKYYQMPSQILNYLVNQYIQYTSKKPFMRSSIEKQLLAIIALLVSQDTFRQVSVNFDIPKASLSVFYNRIINFLNELAPTVIQLPNAEEKDTIRAYYKRKYDLGGVIGILGCTYIPLIIVRKDVNKEYKNKKGFPSMILQVICDHQMRLRDCYVEFKGDFTGSEVLHNSPFYKNVQNKKLSFYEGEKLLAGRDYPLETWCITPFCKNVPTRKEYQKNFNAIHSIARRTTLRNTFALLFGRMKRLGGLEMMSVKKVPSTINAACVLHNLCLDSGIDNLRQYIDAGSEMALRCELDVGEELFQEFPLPDGFNERERMARKLNNQNKQLVL